MQFELTKGSRTRTLALILAGIMAIFVLRLFYMQVIQHSHYVDLANSEQLKQFELPAKRGEIYAMSHDKPTKLVMNEKVYTVFADPKVAEKPNEIIDVVREVAGGNARSNLEELMRKKDTRYQILATKITRTQAEKIRAKKLYGLGFQEGTRRVYPEGELAAQVLGFVNDEGVGSYGIEGALNEAFKGKDGRLQTVTDVRDVPLTIGRNNIRQPAVNGQNVVLTIDRNIQSSVEKSLADALSRSGATRASAIVMDPQTGQVMAMANLPTYRPAEYSQVTDVAAFNNGVISTPYEVGSVAKTFTIATGLDRGVITPQTTFNNTDKIQVGDRTIVNASLGHTGNVSMQTALDWSLNTGMVTIARMLGDGNTITYGARKTMYEYLTEKYRLSKPTGIELAGEAGGVIISPDHPNGNAVQYATMSFGQGMNLTMIQAASAFSSIVNGGVYHEPTVVAGSIDDEGNFKKAAAKPSHAGVISPQASMTARQMIHQSHLATYKPNDPAGYYIGGKTGTSQTIDRATGKYTDDETIGTYLGFGGSDIQSPRYVIMVQISGDGRNLGGGADAKPIFNDISQYLINYLKLEPKG